MARDIVIYSKKYIPIPPLPPWTSKTTDSIKPYLYYVAAYTDTPMIKLSL